jgi:hypothetical protein
MKVAETQQKPASLLTLTEKETKTIPANPDQSENCNTQFKTNESTWK